MASSREMLERLDIEAFLKSPMIKFASFTFEPPDTVFDDFFDHCRAYDTAAAFDILAMEETC